MSSMALISEPSGANVEKLGLPYNYRVRSVYAEEDDSGQQIRFYLFTENRYIVFNATDFNVSGYQMFSVSYSCLRQNGKFRSQQHIYYCTSVDFFGCSRELFECPPLDDEQSESLALLFIVIIIVIFVVLVATIALYVLLFSKNSAQSESNIMRVGGRESQTNDSVVHSKTSAIGSKVKRKETQKEIPKEPPKPWSAASTTYRSKTLPTE